MEREVNNAQQHQYVVLCLLLCQTCDRPIIAPYVAHPRHAQKTGPLLVLEAKSALIVVVCGIQVFKVATMHSDIVLAGGLSCVGKGVRVGREVGAGASLLCHERACTAGCRVVGAVAACCVLAVLGTLCLICCPANDVSQ